MARNQAEIVVENMVGWYKAIILKTVLVDVEVTKLELILECLVT